MKKRKEFFRAKQLEMFDKGYPESINPDLPLDEQSELLPYDKIWEFPRERLKLGIKNNNVVEYKDWTTCTKNKTTWYTVMILFK